MGYTSSISAPEGCNEPAWWFIFQSSKLLVELVDNAATVPQLIELTTLDIQPLRQQYIGMLDGRHCYSVEVDEAFSPPFGWRFRGLRQLYELLPENLFWVAGAASQIVDWDRHHQYCGRCGSKTQDKPYERAKECPQCGLASYPRISPAVIVLVQHGQEILLARAKHFPPGLYSVLAGFVEPGENLESAIHREIKEEVGIRVKDIRYFGSQPWPFPNSLMIAFTCHFDSGDIVINENEMADAGWYTAAHLPAIPPRLSIARQLIDWYVDKDRQAAAQPDPMADAS